MTRLVPHLIPPQYLAFLISLGDLDKARALADRALQTISYRCAALRCAVLGGFSAARLRAGRVRVRGCERGRRASEGSKAAGWLPPTEPARSQGGGREV